MNTFSTVIAWVAYNATAGSNVFHIERLAKVVTPTIILTAAIILIATAGYAKLLAATWYFINPINYITMMHNTKQAIRLVYAALCAAFRRFVLAGFD